jgi:hypothetical protein
MATIVRIAPMNAKEVVHATEARQAHVGVVRVVERGAAVAIDKPNIRGIHVVMRHRAVV